MNKLKTSLWIKCTTPEEVLYSVFSFNLSAIKILEEIIQNSFPKVKSISIDNVEAIRAMLQNDKVKELLKSKLEEIEWWDIIIKAIELYEKDYHSFDTEAIIESTKNEILKNIEEVLKNIHWEQYKKFDSLFWEIEWINWEETYHLEDLVKLTIHLSFEKLICFYELLEKDESLKKHKRMLDDYLYNNYSFSREEFKNHSLEEYIEKWIDWIVLKAINRWWLRSKEYFNNFNLEDYVEKLLDKTISETINKWFIDEKDFYKIPLFQYIEKWLDKTISEAINKRFIDKKIFKKIPLEKYIEKWLDKSIYSGINRWWINERDFKRANLQNYMWKYLSPSSSGVNNKWLLNKLRKNKHSY